MKRVLVGGLLASAALAPFAANAAPPRAPDWAFGAPAGEVALATASVASLAAYFLPQTERVWGPDSPRPFHPSYSLASDFAGAAIGSLLVGSGAYLAEGAYYSDTGAKAPFARALRTTLVDAEAALLATGLTIALKRVSGRCRPRYWSFGVCEGTDTPHEAFPSGHTSPVAAIAGVAFLFAARTPGDGAPRWAAFGFAESAALVTATLRVLAGAHSTSDVAAGWLLGSATGILVALAHPMATPPLADSRTGPAVAPAAFAWSSAF